jgi:hypothetical protein
VDTGAVPATEHQTQALEQVPEGVTSRSPGARGTTAEGMPVSPMQGQVTEELEARFAYFDIDKDGRISSSEAAADPGLESQWQRLDGNDDDGLDRAEFAHYKPEE